MDFTSNFAVVGLINQLYLCLGCKEFECNPLRVTAIRISTFYIFYDLGKWIVLQFPGTTVSYSRKWPPEIEFSIKVWFLSYIGNQEIATKELLYFLFYRNKKVFILLLLCFHFILHDNKCSEKRKIAVIYFMIYSAIKITNIMSILLCKY